MDNKTKSKILGVTSLVVLSIIIPLSLSSVSNENGFHVGVHVSAIILASFLSIVGLITYKDYKTSRLFLIMLAFISITIAEIVTLSTFLISFVEPNTNLDSMITHGLILLMLSFFVFGIFRRD